MLSTQTRSESQVSSTNQAITHFIESVDWGKISSAVATVQGQDPIRDKIIREVKSSIEQAIVDQLVGFANYDNGASLEQRAKYEANELVNRILESEAVDFPTPLHRTDRINRVAFEALSENNKRELSRIVSQFTQFGSSPSPAQLREFFSYVVELRNNGKEVTVKSLADNHSVVY